MWRLVTIGILLVNLAGCASYANKPDNEFGVYTKDLLACGGSPAFNVSLKSMGYAIAGGALGAIEGASTGVFTNSSAEGGHRFWSDRWRYRAIRRSL